MTLQMAVSKYQEVVSNLELVDELNTLALQQIRDAEKTMKKTKKIEKLENKRHESTLIEFVMKTSYLLERIFESESIQSKLLSDHCIESAELNLLKELHYEIHINEKGNWKKCSEHFQSLYEGGSKPTDLNLPDEHVLKSVTKDELLKCIEKVSDIDWISSGVWEDHSEKKTEHHESTTAIDDNEEIEESNVCDDAVEEAEEPLPIVNKEVEPVNSTEKSTQQESTKLSFVFLHESIVQEDSCRKTSENGYASAGGFIEDHVPRSNSQMSGNVGIDDNRGFYVENRR